MSANELYGHPIHAFWARLFGGAIGPVLLLVIGSNFVLTGTAWFPSRYGGMTFEGASAVAAGIAMLGAAAHLHLHYIWRPVVQTYWQIVHLAQLITLGTCIIAGVVAACLMFLEVWM